MKTVDRIKYFTFACLIVASNTIITACSSDDEEEKKFTPLNMSLATSTTMEAVDMGLSVDWASCNVGAKKPTQYGGHYCWGDPSGLKTSYIIDEIKDNISGTNLDIVSENFGNGWRMPTTKEFTELIKNCSYKKEIVDGVTCLRFTAKNGNSILLPFGGYTYGDASVFYGENVTGYYWTAIGSQKYNSAEYIYIGVQNKLPSLYNVSYGASIRGVRNHMSDNKEPDNGGNNTGGSSSGGSSSGGSSSSTTYEKPDVAYHDFTAYQTRLKVVYKIWNNDKAKVTSAKIYYGTTSTPTKYVSASVSSALITGNISGLKKGTTYYVKCVATGKGGTTTTSTTKLMTNN